MNAETEASFRDGTHRIQRDEVDVQVTQHLEEAVEARLVGDRSDQMRLPVLHGVDSEPGKRGEKRGTHHSPDDYLESGGGHSGPLIRQDAPASTPPVSTRTPGRSSSREDDPPPPRGLPKKAVHRAVLLDSLSEALTGALTVLVAPAGAGKSVLLAQWAQAHPAIDAVWIDVDADDAPRLTSLIGDSLAAHAERETVVILDDFHRLSSRDRVNEVAAIVDRLPHWAHMVIATRVDPTLHRAWSRLRDRVTEIRGADLAFGVDDSAELLHLLSGRELTRQNVAALVDRTEGWAAGLQLAGLMLKATDDVDSFIAEFGGTDRLVADYLTQETLDSLPRSLRARLLLASALDEMCGDLVTAATGETGPHEFFETLERESLFLSALDVHREWFRFHPLFRDLLRYYLRAEAPDAEREVLTRAAAWFAERDDVNRAIEYLLRARDWDEAMRLIRSRGAEVYERCEMTTVIRWITELPSAATSERVDLVLLLGVLRAMEGQLVVAEDVLRQVVGHSRATDGERMVARAFIAARAQWSPHPETSVEAAVRAIDFIRSHPHIEPPDVLGITDRASLTTIALFSGGRSLFLCGELDESQRWLARALASEGASYPPWRVSALGALALLEAWRGHTELAQQLVSETLEVAADADLSHHPTTADAYLAAALVATEQGRSSSATAALGEGLSRATANGRTQLVWIAHAVRSEMQARSEMQVASPDVPRPESPPPPVVRQRLAALDTAGRLAELPEPLTTRELEILSSLPSRWSNEELAERFYVSVNTIKTHTVHIYRKLGVPNRNAAIRRARELGLLR